MKYLKSYKFFDSKITLPFEEKFKSEIEDIISDLKDDGHDIYVNVRRFYDYDRLEIYINLNKDLQVNLSKYVETFKHLVSFVEEEGWADAGSYLIFWDGEIRRGKDIKGDLVMNTLNFDNINKRLGRIELRFDRSH